MRASRSSRARYCSSNSDGVSAACTSSSATTSACFTLGSRPEEVRDRVEEPKACGVGVSRACVVWLIGGIAHLGNDLGERGRAVARELAYGSVVASRARGPGSPAPMASTRARHLLPNIGPKRLVRRGSACRLRSDRSGCSCRCPARPRRGRTPLPGLRPRQCGIKDVELRRSAHEGVPRRRHPSRIVEPMLRRFWIG